MGGLGRRKEESERRKEESERTKQALHECLMARSICSNTPIGIPLARTQSYFPNTCKFSSVQPLSRVQLFATP